MYLNCRQTGLQWCLTSTPLKWADEHLLLWAASYLPGRCNQTTDAPSRSKSVWRLVNSQRGGSDHFENQTVISQFSVVHEQDRDRRSEPGFVPNCPPKSKAVHLTSFVTVMDGTAPYPTVCNWCS